MNDDFDSEFADPLARFQAWYAEARDSEPAPAEAMTLATATADGRPSARMVLLKGADEAGFVFYTNSESRKGGELAANAHAALCFHWKSLKREVRVEGPVEKVSAAEADAYFASRARASQIGAWASQQSRPLSSRFELETRIARFTAKFNIGAVPRPPHWEGYRLRPQRVEFWRERRFRLHDRVLYTLKDGAWRGQRLYP